MGYYVMKQIFKRSISLVTVCMLLVVMCFTNVSAKTTATGYKKASDVVYKTYTASSGSKSYAVSKGIINWGARDEDCVFLSKYATAYYTGNNTFDKLSTLKGGSSQTNAPGTALYNALHNLMDVNFTHNYQKTRDLYKYTDCVSNDTSKLVSFYSGTLINSAWDSGATWNREHCWPDSKCLSSGRSEGDSADMHMLRPTKVNENGSRGNDAYGETASSKIYEPADEVKGDCARIALYGYVRWQNTTKMWGENGVIENLDILLKWMQEDPVDTWEMGRNDAVQSITGNRNVFIDYPEFAWLLFGRNVPTNMTTPSGEAKGGVTSGNQGGNNDNQGGNQDDNNDTNSSVGGGTNDNNNDNSNNNDNTTSNDNGSQGGITNKPNNGGKPFDPNNIGSQQVQTNGNAPILEPWVIIAIIAGAVVLVAGTVVAVVVIKKKKTK